MSFITYVGANDGAVYKIDATTGSLVSGYPKDLRQKIADYVTALPETPGTVDPSVVSISSGSFNTQGTEYFSSASVPLLSLPEPVKVWFMVDLLTMEFIGAPYLVSEADTDLARFGTPAAKSPGDLSLGLVFYLRGNAFPRFGAFSRGTGELLFEIEPSEYAAYVGGRYSLLPSGDASVYAGTAYINQPISGVSHPNTIARFDAGTGTGLIRQVVSKRGGYVTVVPTPDGRFLALPAGAQYYGAPVAGAETIDVFDANLAFVESRAILTYNSKNIQNETTAVELRPDLGVLFIHFWADFQQEAAFDVLINLDDLSDQTAVPNYGIKFATLGEDGSQVYLYDPNTEQFTVVNVSDGEIAATIPADIAVEVPSFSSELAQRPAPYVFSTTGGSSDTQVFWRDFFGTREV